MLKSPALSPTGCVTLDQLLNLFVPFSLSVGEDEALEVSCQCHARVSPQEGLAIIDPQRSSGRSSFQKG